MNSPHSDFSEARPRSACGRWIREPVLKITASSPSTGRNDMSEPHQATWWPRPVSSAAMARAGWI